MYLILLILVSSIGFAKEFTIPITYDASGSSSGSAEQEIQTAGTGDGNGEVTYFYVGETLLMSDGDQGDKRYYHQDRLNTLRLVTDQNGNKIAEGDTLTLPFGQPITEASRFTYTGKERDDNLYNSDARYYDADLGTFTVTDPISDSHPYNYVESNPLNKVDPSGLASLPGYFGSPWGPVDFDYSRYAWEQETGSHFEGGYEEEGGWLTGDGFNYGLGTSLFLKESGGVRIFGNLGFDYGSYRQEDAKQVEENTFTGPVTHNLGVGTDTSSNSGKFGLEVNLGELMDHEFFDLTDVTLFRSAEERVSTATGDPYTSATFETTVESDPVIVNTRTDEMGVKVRTKFDPLDQGIITTLSYSKVNQDIMKILSDSERSMPTIEKQRAGINIGKIYQLDGGGQLQFGLGGGATFGDKYDPAFSGQASAGYRKGMGNVNVNYAIGEGGYQRWSAAAGLSF